MAAVPKVLHIVESLDRGAIENWLLRMLDHARTRGVGADWTFYCLEAGPGEFDERARALGARVVASPVPLARTAAFIFALRAELRAGGYDVLHCHHDLMSAVYLAAAAGLGIGKRLVHVHNADEHLPTPGRLKAGLLREPLRRICLAADKVVGISNHTLDTMLAGRPRRQGRDVVHYYGVDPAPFAGEGPGRKAFRQALGLADDALVLLFGGRITAEKNPVFAVDVFASLLAREPRSVLVFAGAGALEGAVAERVRALGLADRVRMLGWRSDLPEIMLQADWFILPRPEMPLEGFGLAVIEAQLAGLRLLLSTGVPDDPLLPGAAVRRLSLGEPADRWAEAALDLMRAPAPSRAGVRAALAASPMDMDRALAGLMALHA